VAEQREDLRGGGEGEGLGWCRAPAEQS